MDFQRGDWVLWWGLPCKVQYANHEIVVFRRLSDSHLIMAQPGDLAADQCPWIQDGNGWRVMPDADSSSQKDQA